MIWKNDINSWYNLIYHTELVEVVLADCLELVLARPLIHFMPNLSKEKKGNEKKNNCTFFFHFLILKRQRSLKSSLLNDKKLVILHSQYHGCWWPGEARSQGISRHGIDLALTQNIPVSTPGRVNMHRISFTTVRLHIEARTKWQYF